MTDYEEVRQQPHYVYTLLGRRGRILYIGCTMDPDARVAVWKRTCNIGPLFERAELQGPFPFAEARRLERELIEQHLPPFNIEHTPRHQRGSSRRAMNWVSA